MYTKYKILYCFFSYGILNFLCSYSEPEEALKSLGELQHISRPVAITFKEMITLMDQCQEVESYANAHKTKQSTAHSQGPGYGRGLLANNPLTLFSGIIPGNLAKTTLYYSTSSGNILASFLLGNVKFISY